MDSAGTGDWHLGHAPDSRTCAQAAQRGYDMADLRARLVEPEDFAQFDYIIAMDRENISNLTPMRPTDFSGKLELFLNYATRAEHRQQVVVPDPYYGGEDGFEKVYQMIDKACEAIAKKLN